MLIYFTYIIFLFLSFPNQCSKLGMFRPFKVNNLLALMHLMREGGIFFTLLLFQNVITVLFTLSIAKKIMKGCLFFNDMAIQMLNETAFKKINEGLRTKTLFLIAFIYTTYSISVMVWLFLLAKYIKIKILFFVKYISQVLVLICTSIWKYIL